MRMLLRRLAAARGPHKAPRRTRPSSTLTSDLSGRPKRGIGFTAFMFAMPVISFGLGTWQVKRLQQKTDLINTYTARLEKDPVILPRHVDPDQLDQYDYRRVLVKGRFRHDLEIPVGPRSREGASGYQLITPLQRTDTDGDQEMILVNRGWVSREHKEQSTRPASLDHGEVIVEGLLRKKLYPTWVAVSNLPDRNEFPIMWTDQFAELTGASPVMVEATADPNDPSQPSPYALERAGVPIPKEPRLSVRNNHMQYIITWYGLSAFTTGMLFVLLRRPRSAIKDRVRAAPF